jgi:hypothetical protein
MPTTALVSRALLNFFFSSHIANVKKNRPFCSCNKQAEKHTENQIAAKYLEQERSGITEKGMTPAVPVEYAPNRRRQKCRFCRFVTILAD